MWLTGLMCGLRSGELAGLRWCHLDIDSEEPSIDIVERALVVRHRYVGQSDPKTRPSRRRIGLHPLLVAALRRHRDDMAMLGLYNAEGFVFCTRTGTPMTLANRRRAFRQLCMRAGRRPGQGRGPRRSRPSLPHAIEAWNGLLDRHGVSSDART